MTATQLSTASNGTSHTQWCTHDTGDTSNPNNAVTPTAYGSRTRGITYTANAITATAGITHSDSWPRRANTPRNDWFDTNAGDPIRSPSNTSLVQYATDGPGANAKASAAQPRKVTADHIAARYSLRSKKNNTNTAGVSFTAAATPTSTPRGQRGLRARQSSVTSAIRTMLIWP
ncbi:hypothetical protein GCM10029964_004000 [Kibdelosporangium lantanae]